jgi:hypothetical protein
MSVDKGEIKYQDLVRTNVFELRDGDLKSHIQNLMTTKDSLLSSVVPSVNQLDQQIELAQHELSSRSASKLAKWSLLVSTLAIVVAAGTAILQMIG